MSPAPILFLAVVLAADYPVQQFLRHELVHVFAARWNASAPPLIQEGLAVWLESAARDGTKTPEHVRLARRCNTDPSPLLDRRYFFAPDRMHDCYAKAGTFTGFLIRRFGWGRFRRFYRRVNRWTFRSLFRREFGMRFEEAWRRCDDECLAMASLNSRLRNDRLFNPLS
jgi:hypothetical protein